MFCSVRWDIRCEEFGCDTVSVEAAECTVDVDEGADVASERGDFDYGTMRIGEENTKEQTYPL